MHSPLSRVTPPSHSTAIFTLIALTLLMPAGLTLAGGHNSNDNVPVTVSTADQAMLREWFDDFVAAMDKKYFGQVEAMNGAIAPEVRIMESEWSHYDLQVARGDVMEKAGRMLAKGKKLSPGRGDGELIWGRFYSLDMHPKSPLVGMLHATIVLQMFADGSVGTGGWLGVMPGTRVEEDLAKLKNVADAHFSANNKSPNLYRQLICKGTHDTIAEFRRKPACSGVSFYGPPVFRESPEQSIRFIASLFDQFVDEYMEITRDRADDEYTAADLAAQDHMRKSWLIDQLFSDPFASKIVPFDAWSFANVPPVIKF